MPRADYKRCRLCGRPASEVGPLSHTRLCGDCALVRRDANNDGIHGKTGPEYVRWLRRRYMEVHRALLDAERANT